MKRELFKSTAFLSQVDFECSFQKTKNSRIIFFIFDTVTLT